MYFKNSWSLCHTFKNSYVFRNSYPVLSEFMRVLASYKKLTHLKIIQIFCAVFSLDIFLEKKILLIHVTNFLNKKQNIINFKRSECVVNLLCMVGCFILRQLFYTSCSLDYWRIFFQMLSKPFQPRI